MMRDDRTTGPSAVILAQPIERIAAQDPVALHTLYELTSPVLLIVAVRILQRRECAEEALQEAFVNVWRYASEYKNSVSPTLVWMRVIVRNRTFDYLRRRNSLAGPEVEWNDMLNDVLASELLGPFDLAVAGQRACHLAVCMQDLDDNQRQALELVYFQGLSHSEVADQMEAPLGTVKAWIRRATKTLKVSLMALETSAPSKSATTKSFSVRANKQQSKCCALRGQHVGNLS